MNPTRWEYWVQDRPCPPVYQLIIPKRPKGTLVDNRTKKRFRITKGSLFDNITVEILSIIDNWINSFEYNYKLVDFVNQIKSTKILFF